MNFIQRWFNTDLHLLNVFFLSKNILSIEFKFFSLEFEIMRISVWLSKRCRVLYFEWIRFLCAFMYKEIFFKLFIFLTKKFLFYIVFSYPHKSFRGLWFFIECQLENGANSSVIRREMYEAFVINRRPIDTRKKLWQQKEFGQVAISAPLKSPPKRHLSSSSNTIQSLWIKVWKHQCNQCL